MKHTTKALAKGVTLLSGVKDECCMYLVEGKDSALLIDTGFGTADIAEEVAGITSLPFQVANTHGHGDHSGGDMYFSKVYMHCDAECDARDALNLNKTVLSKEAVEKIEAKLQGESFGVEFISDGFCFDLGGRIIEAIEIPGHTPGCVAFLDKESRIVFSGDCAVKAMDILLVVPQALSLSAYLASMKKLQARRADFDYICTGHDEYLIPAEFIDQIIVLTENIIAGKVSGEALELPPVFGDTHAMRADGEGFAIAYRPSKLI